MHCEDLLVNNSSNGQAVEAVSKGLPQLNVISSLALVVEAVDAVDRGAFVVTTEDEEVLWVFDLVRKQEADRLQRLLSSVDIVAQEQVVGFRWESTVFEESQEIVILAVDIAANLKDNLSATGLQNGALQSQCEWDTNLDGGLKLQKDRLRDEDLTSFCAEIADLSLQELNLLSRPASSDLQQTVYYGIEIHIVLVRHDVCFLSKEGGMEWGFGFCSLYMRLGKSIRAISCFAVERTVNSLSGLCTR